MNVRERYLRCLNFQPVDRAPLFEFAPWWDKTLDAWKRQGLVIEKHPGLNESQSLLLQFGLDLHLQQWINIWSSDSPKPAYHGAALASNATEYDRLKLTLYPKEPFDSRKLEQYARFQERGEAVVWITLPGPFWGPRQIFGIEGHLYAFYDEPELMHRMNADIAAYNMRVLESICEILTPDFMTFAEDMSYNNGPMISREAFDEFLLPYYQQQIPELKKSGIRVLIDSDGDISSALEWFIGAGAEGILPLERQAGVDLGALRERFPKCLFMGNFDKMCMPKGEAAMRAEFERLLPVMRQGGFCLSVDHQTPPGVTLENYYIFLRLYKEYAHRAVRHRKNAD